MKKIITLFLIGGMGSFSAHAGDLILNSSIVDPVNCTNPTIITPQGRIPGPVMLPPQKSNPPCYKNRHLNNGEVYDRYENSAKRREEAEERHHWLPFLNKR